MDYSPSDLLAAIDRRTRHTAALVPQVLEVMTHPGTTEGAGWDSIAQTLHLYARGSVDPAHPDR